jgi:hypothetical protein
MQKAYSVTIKYSQNVKVFADSVKQAGEKVRASLGVDETMFESIDCKVKQIVTPKEPTPPQVETLPFKAKGKKK